ncbi:hypothetical protein CJP74_03800 [Psittacicella melopsittaci]|uniref:Calcineurin-like phosphoesterase domain-containing protein n=1 Tax=Psittacicella melopsittaci TaxID=2028576 RepID=A0A3A1Y647_9GAMM|nr:metallophosphoesterase [Psittacicella melopsittaci]RIY32739.1 hypothetical protein CJP74_03800 [Psittacicella melopsittaci]
MAKYVIGDIHGCADEFAQLLEKINFNPDRDQLYLVGDLVGRGPKPKEVLDLAIASQAKAVLGNYDLHFLSCLYGARTAKPEDNFEPLLSLSEQEKAYYAKWLQEQGFVREEEGFYLVHAALEPSWTPEQISLYGQKAQEYFASWDEAEFKRVFGNKRFIDTLSELSYTDKNDIALRQFLESMLMFTICRYRAFTLPEQDSILVPPNAKSVVEQVGVDKLNRLQPSLLIKDFSKPYYDLNVSLKCKPEPKREEGLYPWFDFVQAKKELFKDHKRAIYGNANFNFLGFKKPIYFGHWSFCNGVELVPGVICTDTSCVYGGRLSAYKLPEFAVNMQDEAFLLKLAQPYAWVEKIN